MASFSVRTETLNSAATDFEGYAAKIENVIDRADTILKNSRKQLLSASILRTVKDRILIGSIDMCVEDMRKLSTAVASLAQLYALSEENVINKDFQKAIDFRNGFSKGGFADFGPFDLTKTFLDNRNDTLDSVLYALCQPLTEGVESLFNKAIGGDTYVDEMHKETILRMIAATINKDSGIADSVHDALSFLKTTAGTPVSIADGLMEGLGEEGLDKVIGGMGGKAVANIGALLELGDTGVEIAELYLTDYAQTISALEKMKEGLQAVGGNEATVAYIDDIIADYNSKFTTSLSEAADAAINISVDKGLEYATTAATSGLFTVANGAHSIIWEVFDLPDKGDALASIYSSSQYSDDLVAAYEFYADRLESGNYTQNDVEMCQTMFDMAKQAKLDEYYNIRNFVKGDQEDYLNQKITELEALTWNKGF